MNTFTKSALFAAASLLLAGGAVAADEHQHHMGMDHSAMTQQTEKVVVAQGVVENVKADQKAVTITHEPIAALQWPGMTMDFQYADDNATVKSLKKGDKVRFSFVQRGDAYVIKQIKAAK